MGGGPGATSPILPVAFHLKLSPEIELLPAGEAQVTIGIGASFVCAEDVLGRRGRGASEDVLRGEGGRVAEAGLEELL